jgi:hypothetical protein
MVLPDDAATSVTLVATHLAAAAIVIPALARLKAGADRQIEPATSDASKASSAG